MPGVAHRRVCSVAWTSDWRGTRTSEPSNRFRKAVLSEHLLTQHLLIGVNAADLIEVVALVDDLPDHTALTTVVAPTHPSQDPDGAPLVSALRSMGWTGPLSSSVALGNTLHERFHEAAGFVPGDVIVDRIQGHDVFRREWWLEPALSAAG